MSHLFDSSSGRVREVGRLLRRCGASWAMGLVLVPAVAAGQSGLEATCRAAAGPDQAECLLGVATVRTIQERAGTALWGGSPVPGTASTLGMKIGSTPRVSVSGRLVVVPAALPPLLDRGEDQARRTVLPGMGVQATVGVLPGWSPLPTVGGVMSLDLIGRLSLASLPGGPGFRDGTTLGWSAGARVGVLRESFTLPGVSVTTSYGRSSSITFGDLALDTSDGFTRGAISDLNATLAVSQRISALRLTGGVAVDRYATNAVIGYTSAETGLPVLARGRVTTDRRSWFANAAWTFLIFHAVTEVGWQVLPGTVDLPEGVRIDPVGWWAGAAFRVSI
jgi:hypothetical protein